MDEPKGISPVEHFVRMLELRRNCPHSELKKVAHKVWECRVCGTSFEDADGTQWISTERAHELRARYG